MRKTSTTKQRILKALQNARDIGQRYKIHGEYSPRGWVPAFIICAPNIGGLQGTRRIRELRANGINILWKYFFKQNGTFTNTTLYYLSDDTESIDFEKCCRKNNES